MHLKNYKLFLIPILVLSFFISCQKSIDPGVGAPPTSLTPVSTTVDDKLKDSVLLYTREIYLWYNQIPASFNPRTFADPDKIMQAIRQYSVEPGFTAPVDRFSFAMKQTEYNNLASGISADFGFSVFFFAEGDLRVKYVERESAAGKAGIRRGWRITKINNSTDITTSNSTFIVDNVFYSATTTFTFIKPDGSSVTMTLNASSYKTHPVMADSVYSIGGKSIGYIVFKSFLGDIPEINSELNRVFSRFASANVNDVIVDLRYNGGGYVSVAETLSNYLAPSSATGSVMMTQQFNDKLGPRYNSTTNFNKKGSINLSRVFFIVSSSTASASELLINNLKPVINDVKLIGRNSTYGKPVGFFPQPVGDWFIFPVSFRTVNKSGVGNYFNGFAPDATVADGVDKDFGDVTESSLASAIKYITTGTFRYQAGQAYQELPQVTTGNLELDEPSFKGTISNRK
ncbi:MAG TPA: S41 family peptidase [Chitinophagaceae bacterium]|nr:S41 family peptidase [Chitinophagaceae bacterium]